MMVMFNNCLRHSKKKKKKKKMAIVRAVIHIGPFSHEHRIREHSLFAEDEKCTTLWFEHYEQSTKIQIIFDSYL